MSQWTPSAETPRHAAGLVKLRHEAQAAAVQLLAQQKSFLLWRAEKHLGHLVCSLAAACSACAAAPKLQPSADVQLPHWVCWRLAYCASGADREQQRARAHRLGLQGALVMHAFATFVDAYHAEKTAALDQILDHADEAFKVVTPDVYAPAIYVRPHLHGRTCSGLQGSAAAACCGQCAATLTDH